MELSGSFLKAVTAPPPPHLAPRLLLQHSSALLIGGDERHFQLPVPISTSAWSWALAHFLGCMFVRASGRRSRHGPQGFCSFQQCAIALASRNTRESPCQAEDQRFQLLLRDLDSSHSSLLQGSTHPNRRAENGNYGVGGPSSRQSSSSRRAPPAVTAIIPGVWVPATWSGFIALQLFRSKHQAG